VIALDTNILVYARREETSHHARAREILKQLAEGEQPWALLWPCIYEFIRVVTHPRVFDPPTNLESALDDLDSLLQSPSLTLLREGPRHSVFMQRLLRSGQAAGNLAHDAHIAALIVEHGVGELWTADRDFARFPGIRVRNPFNTQN
jgi:toxin-antitoxin system PIN domain toxin